MPAQAATAGTLGGRPSPSFRGQRYFATDTDGGTLYESFDGSTWTKIAPGVSAEGGGAVSSVAGRTGAVTLTSADIGGLTEAAQDAVGSALTDTSTLDLTYNDGSNAIS